MNDTELAALAELLAGLSQGDEFPASWHAWFGAMAEELRVELARRKIQQAIERDPLGYYLGGRLE